ncbi:SDR family NAD(P)-dependent oxidoreductase [Pseudalkalibacillus caeni]|uniref:SDR family oxidoreductase n=1 Tax=Exobacillus caeni TaxID=2574798 RepID=A0A5R9F4H0_9BACL|nr:SDR family oxidoreductase [Pseudalkalibacillus caeni]TLS35713.1 SDR family oxidoreductase [Pseudalkalibacillus caeni]
MKTIVVTGGGSGLGKELSKQLAGKDIHIFLLGRNHQFLDRTQKEVEEQHGVATSLICDIRNPEAVNSVLQSILQAENKVDMLINNAGLGFFGPLETISVQEIDQMVDTNIKGTIYMTQAFLPYLKKQKKSSIINIISTAGQKGKVNESVYVASKYAVRGFTESLWKELEGSGVTATAVYMGGMDTPFWEDSTHISDRSRLKSPEEVASEIIEQLDGREEIFINR